MAIQALVAVSGMPSPLNFRPHQWDAAPDFQRLPRIKPCGPAFINPVAKMTQGQRSYATAIQAGHMIASDPVRTCFTSCEPGAVHIRVPALGLGRDDSLVAWAKARTASTALPRTRR